MKRNSKTLSIRAKNRQRALERAHDMPDYRYVNSWLRVEDFTQYPNYQHYRDKEGNLYVRIRRKIELTFQDNLKTALRHCCCNEGKIPYFNKGCSWDCPFCHPEIRTKWRKRKKKYWDYLLDYRDFEDWQKGEYE